VKHSETTSSILTEDARRKTFIQNTASEAYSIQSTGNRQQRCGRSSSCRPNASRSRSKSRDTWTCNYCKKPGHIKAYCRALKSKNEKLQKCDQRGSHTDEVNWCGSSSTSAHITKGEILEDDPNILTVESSIEAEALLTMEETTSWLLDSGTSYHVIPFCSQF
jgi:hypothetical protein